MFRKPGTKTSVITACILLPVILTAYWLWATARNWNFIGAVETGNINKVRAGLDSGIDPDKATMKGAIALRLAVNGPKPGNSAIISLLLDHGANPNSGLWRAAACQPPDIVRLLLDRGANPTYGLCSAVEAKRPDIVQLLIERGANVNAECSDGKPVLLNAAEYGNNQIVRLVKAAGARK